MPCGQIIWRARVGGRRDRSACAKYVAHVTEEREVVIHRDRRVQVDVDEAVDVAEPIDGHAGLRRLVEAVGARRIEAALVGCDRLDLADIIGGCGQRELAGRDGVLPVATPVRRAVARRQVIRTHRASELLDTLRRVAIILDDVGRLDPAGEADALTKRDTRGPREVEARRLVEVHVHERRVDDQQAGSAFGKAGSTPSTVLTE